MECKQLHSYYIKLKLVHLVKENLILFGFCENAWSLFIATFPGPAINTRSKTKFFKTKLASRLPITSRNCLFSKHDHERRRQVILYHVVIWPKVEFETSIILI